VTPRLCCSHHLLKGISRLLGAMFLVWPAVVASAQEAAPLVAEHSFQTVSSPATQTAFPVRLDAAEPAVAPPIIDGLPGDVCWRRAAAIRLGSDMGAEKPERPTTARICYDARNLYVLFECTEPDLVKYWGFSDPQAQWAENVQLFLKPCSPRSPVASFTINPRDNARTWNSKEGASWSPKWQMKTALLVKGWCAEMAIPFASLGLPGPEPGKSWRANFCRGSVLTGEQSSWQPTRGNLDYAPQWGRLFFGTSEEYKQYAPPAAIRAWPERYVIRSGEKTLRMVIRIDPGKRSIEETILRLATSRERETDGALESLSPVFTAPVTGERAFLTLNTATLPSGEFFLHADLLDADGNLLARDPVPLKAVLGSPPRRRTCRMAVIIQPCAIKAKAALQWPITTGVALPRGAIFSPRRARLLAPDGAEIPAQTGVRARWPDGSIQWLSLDFRADVSGAAPVPLTLEFGPDVKRKSFKGFIRENLELPFHVVERNWMVNTGKLLFTITLDRFTGIQAAWVDVDRNDHFDWDEYIIDKELGGRGPYLKDAAGNTYGFDRKSDVRVELVEWNELRLELRAEGELVLVERGRPAGQGDKKETVAPKLGRCIVRITAYAGQPFLRIRYTFLLTREAARTALDDVGVEERFEYDFGRRVETAFGVPDFNITPLRKTGDVNMVWVASNRYLLRSEKGAPPINLTGDRAENWVCGHSQNRGMVLYFRDMNSLFPKSFEMVADGALMRAHFWPPREDEIIRKLRAERRSAVPGELAYAHYGKILDLRVPASFGVARETAPEDTRKEAPLPDYYRSDPTGVALTYDTLYYFYRGDFDPEEISAVGRIFQMRPHALQDRAALAAAGVVPDILDPEQARIAVAAAKRLLAREDRLPEPGDFNFLDLHRAWDKQRKLWARPNQWMSTRADLPGALWQLYLQTGDIEILRAAERNLRHVVGLDFCHDADTEQTIRSDPRDRKIPGAFSGHQTPIHWQNTVHVSDRYARLRALLLAWYLTGDSAAREAVTLWQKAALDCGAPTSGEDGAVFIDNLSSVLQLEYNPAALEILGRCVDFFAGRPCEPAAVDTWGRGLRSYLARSGDPRIHDALEQVAQNKNVLKACADRFALLGLLRDVDFAAGRSLFRNAGGPRNVTAFEQRVKKALAQNPPEDDELNWRDLCVYIFAGGKTGAVRSTTNAAKTRAAP